MRSPGRRRPRREDRLAADSDVDLELMAEKVTYTISPEHKNYLTAAGPGKLRSDATACPRGIDFGQVEDWLKAAVRQRRVSADLDGSFPRYVWARVGDRVYEGRLTNAGQGSYKGYPIKDYEAPGWLE